MTSPQLDCGRVSRRGLTLTEVVVVVGIVSILYAILAPVLFSARLRARETHCASNLRQIWMALQLYRQDYSDFPNWAPARQLQPAYISTPSILRCPLEYRDLQLLDESTVPDSIQSSYMWPCIPSRERNEAYARRGEETPCVICSVHLALNARPPVYGVVRYHGGIEWVPFRPSMTNTFDL